MCSAPAFSLSVVYRWQPQPAVRQGYDVGGDGQPLASSESHMATLIEQPVVKGTRYVLVHAPDLVRFGSKPLRELARQPDLLGTIQDHLQPFESALAYPPNQAFVGGIAPDDLKGIPRPWYERPLESASRHGRYGEIMPEDEFYGVLRIVDDFDLLWLESGFAEEVRQKLTAHSLITAADLKKLDDVRSYEQIEEALSTPDAVVPLYLDGQRLVGCFNRAHEEDPALTATRLLENLTCKATAMLSLRSLLASNGTAPESIEFILGSGEESVGDRYNPGGGNLAKAIGEVCGCTMASGADIKDFCCGPVQAMTIAGALVASRMYRQTAVVGGCSLAKLGMKYQGHLKHDMPILEDVLAGFATIIGENDGRSPQLRIDAVGRHTIGTGSSQQAIMQRLVAEPAERTGRKLTDVGKYATELHNPEVTEPSGSGNVPQTNYTMIAAMAVLREEIAREEMPQFVDTHGMPGYSPTQGHIASAIPFLAHAQQQMQEGELDSAMFLAKGSLFLGRMTQLSDGVSVILERNGG